MITVAGFNTAIDRRIDLDVLQPGHVQRARTSRVRPGGKGLHVAQMAVALGESVHLVGLDDAAHGALLHDYLHARGVQWHAVRTPHDLRQCLAVHETGGRVTEILEPGAELDAGLREALLAALDALLDDAHVLVLSGSLPPGFPADTYAHLVHKAATRDVRCLLDASGEALRAGVAARPWLVKPNADEASALWGQPVHDVASAAAFAMWLQARGVDRVIVTLGARGALGFDGRALWHAQSAPVDVRDSVGSGDCLLAGLAVASVRGDALQAALRLAVACGAANAEGGEAGFAAPERITAWMQRVEVTALPICTHGAGA